MKKTFLFAGSILISLLIVSQSTSNGQVKSETLKPENKIYTVAGERHGVSFFPEVNFKYVQYTPGDTLSFNQYHTGQVMLHWLKKWADQYPDLIDLYVVGKSFEGRPVYQITLTNKKTDRKSVV